MSAGQGGTGQAPGRPGSGVLGRMVQRSRGPLSSLEPVIRPRFAPRAEGFVPGDGRPADVLAPAELDADAVDTRPPGLTVPGQEAPAADLSGSPATLRAADGAGHSPRDGPRSVPREASGGDAAAAERAFPPTGGLWPAAPALSGGATAWDAAWGDTGRNGAASDGPAPLEPSPLIPAITARPGASRPATRSADPGNRASGASPPVTITIGHIEVRAAAVTQRPARQETTARPRPAFRPQTTLADFLDGDAAKRRGSGRR